MTNQTHSSPQNDYRYNSLEEINAYDLCPAAIREKIRNAKFSISSKMALNLWKNLRNEEQVLLAIDQIEKQMLEGKL